MLLGQKEASLSFSWAQREASKRDRMNLPANVEKTTASTPQRVKLALLLLLDSYDYSQDIGCDIWQFAVELRYLRPLGMTASDLRWLHMKGLIEHAREVRAPGETERSFRHGGILKPGRRTCFVLTEAGQRQARRLSAEITAKAASPQTLPAAMAANGFHDDDPAPAPTWDRDRQQLRLGRIIVKEFKAPAPNQEALLSAFEEEHWPPRIDDPLPPIADLEPKRRLHDTINSLNRNQKTSLIRFMGDGSGEGVRWEYIGREAVM